MGRFLTRDTWSGDANRPLSFNRWGYVEGNPVNFVDPSGNYRSCYKYAWGSDASDQSYCNNSLSILNNYGQIIESGVSSGVLGPVEGFAQFMEHAQFIFANEITSIMWATTIVLDDMDANRGWVWPQATFWMGSAGSNHYVQQDWLPYKNNPEIKSDSWPNPGGWTHSLRGDWKKIYWDKTANQAYHFWYFASVAFFDTSAWAHTANIVHDNPLHFIFPGSVMNYDFIGSDPNIAPPYVTHWNGKKEAGISLPDFRLALKGIQLGDELKQQQRFRSWACDQENILPAPNIASWIRSNLKEY